MGSVLRRIKRSGIHIAAAEGVRDERRKEWRGTTTAGERRELASKRRSAKRRKRSAARQQRKIMREQTSSVLRDVYELESKCADVAKALGDVG